MLFVIGQNIVLANYVINVEMHCSRISTADAHNNNYTYQIVAVGRTVYFCASCDHGWNPDHRDLVWVWDFGCVHGDTDSSDCGRDDDLDEHSSHTYGATEAGEYDPSITITLSGLSGSERTENVHIHVVKVDKIKVYNDGEWHDKTDQTIYLLNGSKYTFKAYPYPSGPWPPPDPVTWTYSGTDPNTTDGDEIEITFTSTGTKTLKATCGPVDTGKTVTIVVVEPEPDQLSFVDWFGNEEHDIDGVTDPVWKRVSSPDDPASYTKDNYISLKAKFWASQNLTFQTAVWVDAETVAGEHFILDNTVTFQSWPSETTEHGSNFKLANKIYEKGFTIKWKYKVPSGYVDWIWMPNTGSHTIYAVYEAPKCDSGEYTEAHIDHSVTWGDTGVLVTENDIPKKIQENCWINFATGHLPNPWDLETTQGDCQTHAELMAEALKVLGIDADGSSTSTCRVGETRWCGTHSTTEYHWFVEVDSTTATNFEGVCEVNLIDETTPWKCYYDKAMGEVGSDPAYQKGTHTNMWTEWNNNPPPNYKVIHHFTNWDNH
jgi:hypothetical protein